MKKFKLFLSLFMLCVIVCGICKPMLDSSDGIASKVFRLHIIANSDEVADQSLKLKIRDNILNSTEDLFTGDTLEENLKIANNNLECIKEICIKTMADCNSSASIDVSIDKEFFDTRVYDDFTLPAGVYNSLKIVIGEGKGHNWWCIVFPQVCLSACSKSMNDYLTDDEMALIEQGYTPKLKIIEIYEKLRYKCKNN